MKLFVAVPAYDNRVTLETARALLNEQGAAGLLQVEMQVAFLPGNSLITHARNQAVRDFLASGADKLVFIDSDVSWCVGELLKLASHDVDLVSGAYRYKDDREGYPIEWIDKPELHAVNGLLEVMAVPAGFLAIKRRVFEQLQARFPERAYAFHGQAFQAFFHCPPGEGEDGAFCRDWRSLGGKVWLDPELTLSHYGGSRNFTGNIGKWLKSR